MELVSIVIPAYNAEGYIKDALKSCFNQTYRPIEIVVVNDGSTDNTVNVVNSLYASITDSRVTLKVIDISENKGAANALNVGFSKAEGDYICWLSADDIIIDKKKTQKQINYMKKTGALWSYYKNFFTGLTFQNAKFVRSSYLPNMHFLDPLFITSHDLRLMILLFRNPINGSSIMIRKDCIDSFGQFDPITKNVDGDGDLWLRYSALKLKLKVLNDATVFYRQHPTQTSKKITSMIYGCELTRMRMLLSLYKKGALANLIKKFTPFFPAIFAAKLHLKRPFVSEFLFKYILSDRKKFSKILLKLARRALKDSERRIRDLMLNRNKFLEDLEVYMKSPVFKEFEAIYFKG